MKKKLIITESQYNRLINEQDDDYTEQLLLLINSNDETNLEMVKEMIPGLGINLFQFLSDNIEDIEPPYFYKFNFLGIDDKKDQLEILKYVFGGDIKSNPIQWSISNLNGKLIYFESSDGYWSKYEYDSRGNRIYSEDSKGRWNKKEYDSNNNEIYYENSNGEIIDIRDK